MESSEANDNLPLTFEGLVDALGKAEATKILRSSSPVDPMISTAHMTTGGTRPYSPAVSTPTPCAGCGAAFFPKKSMLRLERRRGRNRKEKRATRKIRQRMKRGDIRRSKP